MTAQRRLLILGAAEVQRDAVEVARDQGHWVAVAAAALGPAADLADHAELLDLLDVDGVERLAAQLGVDAVYSVGSDRAMPTVAEVSRRLGLPALVTLRTAVECNDKGAMRARLAGQPGQLRSALVADGDPMPAGMAYPVVVKPTDSQGQRGVALVHGERELAGAVSAACAFSRDGRAILEDYVPGPELSANGYLRAGELVFFGVSDREVWPDHLGLVRAHRYPSRVDDTTLAATREVVLASARAMGLTDGPVYAQLKAGPQGPVLIEITPRLDGCHLWRLWREAAGVDLLAMTLDDLLGEGLLGPPEELPDDGSGPRHGEWLIEFDALPPGSTFSHDASRPAGEPASDEIHHRSYYADGQVVRPINGRLEKVGYRLRRAERVGG